MRLLPLLILSVLPTLAVADELSQKKSELQALRQEILQISASLTQNEQEKDALSRDIERVEKRLAGLRSALRVIRGDLKRSRAQTKRLQLEQADFQQQLKQQYHKLESQLRTAFMLGRQARSRMLLSQNDPARLARLQVYLQHFQRQHQRQIAGFETTLRALNSKQQEAQQALSELQQAELSQKQTLASIQKQRAARKQVLLKIEQRLQQQGQSIARLRAEQERLEKLIDALGKATLKHSYAAPAGKFAENQGKLIPPAKGRYLAHFRQTKPDGTSHWNGVWIAAEKGSGVLAIADARVVYVGWMHQLGLLMVLDHGDGYFSLYGHNQSALKSVGDEVKAGDTIAEAGDTGGHTKSGVYLEIRKGRKALNPTRWLNKARS